MMKYLAPSLLSADFLHLEREIEMINRSEADWIHCDIMDGVFVPNISFGFSVMNAIKSISHKPLDIHLMIIEPEKYIKRFHACGAHVITVHYEACKDICHTLRMIRSLGIMSGVSISPNTPVSVLEKAVTEADLVLLMSVEPGFGGQKFIPHTFQKIAELKALCKTKGCAPLIEVDGGIVEENICDIYDAGFDVVVAGSTIFKAPDPIAMIHKLKS